MSGGSNLGPTSAKLVLTNTVQQRTTYALRKACPPARLCRLTWRRRRASGLDPAHHPCGCELQVPSVAKARGMTEADVQKLVDQYTEGRDLGFLGEPRVNVLKLNLALDALQGGRVMDVGTADSQTSATPPDGVNVITISRQYGAGASELARMLADRLGFRVIDDELLQMAAERSGMDLAKIERVYEQRPSFQDLRVYKERSEKYITAVNEVLDELAQQGNVIIVGGEPTWPC